MINEKVINGAAINGSPNYRYRFAPSVDDVVSVVDGEVQRQFNVTMTGALDVLESITATYIPGDSGGTIYTQTREDFITVGDEVLLSLLRGVVVLDVVLLTDDFVRVLVRGRTLIELLTLTDPTTATREIEIAVSEDIEVTDQTIRSILFQRVTSDGLTLLDFIIGDAANVTNVTVSEFIALVDEALRSIERGRTLTDTALFSDELALSIARLATLIESVTIQDGNLNIFLRNTRITEGVTVTDQVLTSLLLAVLYNVRVFIGHAVDVRLSWVRGPELGAYA
jgi:hypothetical protein